MSAMAGFDPEVLSRQRYLTVVEAAVYLRFPSAKAFWSWAKRQGMKACKVGRANLWRREDLERHIEASLGETKDQPRLVHRARRTH